MLLILLQFLITFWSVRSARFANVIRSEPALLVRKGQFCSDATKRESISEGEALSGELVAKISLKSTCSFWKAAAR